MASFITPESTGVVTSGTADILINGSTHTAAVHGEVTFPGLPCPGSSCEVNMAFDLTADNVGVGDFLGIAGVTLEGLEVGGAGTPGQLVLGADGRGTYPAGTVQAWGRGSAVERVLGVEISRTTSGFLLSTNLPVDVQINWTAATFSVDGEFNLPAGDDPVMDPAFTVRLSLTGSLTNQPPTAVVAATPTQECTSPDGSEVTLDASGSFDPDGPIPLFSWRRGISLREPNLLDPDVGTAPIVTVQQAAGTTETYTVLVGDGLGNYDEAETTAAVVDTTAPTIDAITLAHECLWPPNHKFVRFELGDEVLAEVSDACDEAVAVRVVGVSSSEPDDDRGDGSTVPDILFGETGFCLRSERAGSGPGRVYTATLEVEDSSGNRSTTDVQVRVPHESEAGCRLDPSELLSDREAMTECTFPAAPLAVQASRPPEVVRVDDPRPPPMTGRPAGCSASPTSRAPLGLAFLAALVLVLPRRGRPSR